MIGRIWTRAIGGFSCWLGRNWSDVGWIMVVVLTGWLPLAAVGWGWWEFSDEVLPVRHPYSASPARKIAGLRRGKGPPLVISHRGDHLFGGQNSVESFQRSIVRGYDGIELDVMNTADDVPIVSHGFTIGGDRQMYVPEASVDQIQDYADSLEADQGRRHQTLDQVLSRFANKTVFIIEIKAKEDTSYGVEPRVCETIKKNGAADSVIISSLKYHVIETLDHTPACRGIAVMYEVSGSGGDPPDEYSRPVLGMRHDFLADRKSRAPEAVRAFSVYTPNRAYFIRRAIADGALIIQTDRPGRAMRLRDQLVDW